ncbi:MAG: YihY/virulence factor BrkB family protein [Bdellovibrionaceae bacterium]|nr:YihY/virulence factor BrkB family protein [Pseudobdellovibrionaceae bacterium]
MGVREFFRSFFARFNIEQTSTFAASLSYYTALSLAPLLILFITVSSKVSVDLIQTFVIQLNSLIGPDAAAAFELVLQNAKERPQLASASGVFGIITLLFSASLIFGELKTALNQILFKISSTNQDMSNWETIVHFTKSRILHIGFALCFIFIMVVSLTISSVISATFSSYQDFYRILNIGVSFIFYVGIFSLLFRYLPDKKIFWQSSLYGGTITALLFVIGKEFIGIYLGNSAIGSAYGAAGSIIVLLVWVYYSSLITFVGAHVSALLFWKENRS